MKKILIVSVSFIILTASSLIFVGCTENSRARHWGGTEKIEIKKNEVLLNATWKESNLWVLTQDTITKVNHFREHSSYGIMEGEILMK
jgi:hypothetical protein